MDIFEFLRAAASDPLLVSDGPAFWTNYASSVNTKSLYDETPLFVAATIGQPKLIQVLCDYGANPTLKSQVDQVTPLYAAIRSGSHSCAECLLSICPDLVNIASGGCCSPLAEAVTRSDPHMVELLLNHGAVATMGPNPLHEAVMRGDGAILDVLLHHGVDTSVEAAYEGTVLHTAASAGRTDIVQQLCSAGADVDVSSSSTSRTPVHCAALAGHSDTIEILAACGANLNAVDNSGRTPLIYAVSHDDVPCVLALIDHGADINIPEGQSPALTAAMSGAVHSLAILIDLRADDVVHGAMELRAMARGDEAQHMLAMACGR